MSKPSSSTVRKAFLWIGGILFSIILLLGVVILAIRTPWAQQFITDKAVNFVSEKTGTKIAIEKLFITFRGDVQLEGVYLEDRNADTLIYLGELEAGIAFLPLINGNINISRVNLNGLVASVERYRDSTFNFTFIIDAFAGKPKPKDETKESTIPNMKFGPISLTNLDLHYRDEIIGLEADLIVGDLELKTKKIDINTLKFEVKKLELSNATGKATKWLKNTPFEDDSTASKLPYFWVKELALNNIKLIYSAPADSLFTGINLDILTITKAEVNLNEQIIEVKELILKNTAMMAHLPQGDKKDSIADSEPNPFEWPDWKIAAKSLEFENNSVDLKIGKPKETPGQFNPMDMRILGLGFSIEDVEFGDKKASLTFNQLTLSEKSGFELEELAFKLEADDKGATISGLNLTTPYNHITTEVKAKFASLGELISNPLKASFELDLAEADLSIEDAYFFATQLKKDTLLRKISAHPIKLSGFISGKMEDISISNLRLSALAGLQLSLSGTIKGLPDTSKITVDIPDLNLSLTRKDLAVFMKAEKTTSIPDSINLQATVSGGVKELLAKLNVKTTAGDLKLDATAKDLLSQHPSAKGKLELTELNVNKLAAVPDLEPVSLTLDFDAAGKTIETLVADVSIEFQQLKFKRYDYSNLKLTIAAADQKANLKVEHTDENLDFDLLVNALLDTVNPSADLKLNLTGIDVYELGLSAQKMKFGATVNASYAGPLDNFETSLSMENGIIVKGAEVYRLKPVNISLNNAKNSTDLRISSEIVNGSVKANTSLDTLIGSLTNYVKKLMSADSLRAGIMNDSLDVAAHFTINNSRVLTEALLPKLEQMDSIRIDLEFHPKDNTLSLNLSAPKIVYADYTLDSLGMNASANGEVLNGALAFRSLRGGPVDIHRTKVDFGFQNKVMSVALAISDSTENPLAAIRVEIDVSKSNTEFHLAPDGFVLNGEKWSIPADNLITMADDGMVFRSVQLSQAAQSLRIDNLKDGGKNGLKVSFKGFELSSLTTIVNNNDSLFGGIINGTVRLVNLNKTLGIEADLTIDRINALGMDVGTLKLLANNKRPNAYDINLSLKGKAIDLMVKGALLTEDELAIDFALDLNRLDIKLVEKFAQGQIADASGSIQAHSTISGKISDLKYKGYLAFENTALTLAQLNAPLKLPNDRINIDNEGLVLKDFDIRDKDGNKLSINGTVKTAKILDPEFDLKITATNFQPLNSTRDDSELFYGKAFIDLDVDVKGSLSLPRVKANAKLRKGTDVTFIVPESRAAIEERKGLVRFENMKDTLKSILEPDQKVETPLFNGIDLIGYLEIDRETEFKIIIDERSGDNIQIQGEAKLNVEVTPNGIITLSGNYEIVSGSYDLKFYGLARRKFELVSGSRIVWSGDPLEGQLDLSAKYDVKVSASDLMADQLAQSDAATQTRYRQALPFEVMLNIDGQLLKPEISFGIDMPESARQALDGNVYKRVKQLNNTQSELEKQVFSLIVLNRFLPQSFDQGDGSGTERVARSSVSKLLSGQLNAYSAKYLKGVEINFDLNSYTDYQSGSAQGKTELGLNVRKALFNDRLVVQVGGQVDVEGQNKSYGVNDILGDLSLEYLLTEEGQYRLKAFRKNEYQDLVQGQVVATGLSVLFNKSYNSWQELFAKIPKKEEPVEDDEESEEDSEENGDEKKEDKKP